MYSVVQDETAGNFDQGQRKKSLAARTPDAEDLDFEEEVPFSPCAAFPTSSNLLTLNSQLMSVTGVL